MHIYLASIAIINTRSSVKATFRSDFSEGGLVPNVFKITRVSKTGADGYLVYGSNNTVWVFAFVGYICIGSWMKNHCAVFARRDAKEWVFCNYIDLHRMKEQ